MAMRLALLLCLALLPALAAAAEEPRLGVDYEVLPLPAPTYGHGGIEVAEVFSYACVHCAHFQPLVTQWRKTQPKDVRWEYVPADFGGIWNTMARAYFAADELHSVEKTHDAVFRAIHEEHKLSAGTPEAVADLYQDLGVNRAKFLAAMTDARTEERLRQARSFVLACGIDSTPTVMIDGRYRVRPTGDRGFQGMLDTIDYLVARERAAISGSGQGSPKP
jgi:thiol:disulfide interchange protein DsbA